MLNEKLQIHIAEVDYNRALNLYAVDKIRGKRVETTHAMVPYEEHTIIPPSQVWIPVIGKQIMNELWRLGYRPSVHTDRSELINVLREYTNDSINVRDKLLDVFIDRVKAV